MKRDEKKYLLELGGRIENLRKAKGLTQSELAKRIGTQHPQIGRLERGETNATIIILRKIAQELDVSLADLV